MMKNIAILWDYQNHTYINNKQPSVYTSGTSLYLIKEKC
jgi:hypothetical protein